MLHSEPSNIIEEVNAAEPVDTTYVAGRWHQHRVSLTGLKFEARTLIKSLITTSNFDMNKFLIIGRARSGTTLLTGSLNAHPDVTCDGEVLHHYVFAPVTFLENLARISKTKAYGAKLLSYQMIQVQKFADPIGFLEKLGERGFRFIHIERDTFSQTLSWQIASLSRHFHSFMTTGTAMKSARLDPDYFVRLLKWNVKMLEYEQYCLRDIPHMLIDYDRDLLEEDVRRDTLNRMFEWLGVPAADVTPPVKKLLSKDPRDIIENFDEAVGAVKKAGIGHFLPEAYR